MPKKYGKYNYLCNCSNLADYGKLIGICMFNTGGFRESLAVNIQQLNKEPNMINTGKNVIGRVMKSTPKP